MAKSTKKQICFNTCKCSLFTSAPRLCWRMALQESSPPVLTLCLDFTWPWHLRVSFYPYLLGMVIKLFQVKNVVLEFCCKVFRIWFLHQICVLNLSSYMLISTNYSWYVAIFCSNCLTVYFPVHFVYKVLTSCILHFSISGLAGVYFFSPILTAPTVYTHWCVLLGSHLMLTLITMLYHDSN